MSRDKQIEEMAKYCCNPCDFESNGKCVLDHPIGECEIATETAKALYNAGYRKASEVIDEILAIISSKYEAVTTDCHLNMRYGNVDTPNGMRDLGKAEMLKYIGDKIAELKKKYTEDK